MEDFASYIAAERERLLTRRNEALEARRQADADVAAVDAEFVAIEAYQAAKAGKPIRSAAGARTNGATRVRRGSRRAELLDLIQSHSGNGGIRRREILEAMGLKGDKSGEMSVSNALTALVKSNQVSRDGNNYIPIAA